jgi:hypothetical protein
MLAMVEQLKAEATAKDAAHAEAWRLKQNAQMQQKRRWQKQPRRRNNHG